MFSYFFLFPPQCISLTYLLLFWSLHTIKEDILWVVLLCYSIKSFCLVVQRVSEIFIVDILVDKQLLVTKSEVRIKKGPSILLANTAPLQRNMVSSIWFIHFKKLKKCLELQWYPRFFSDKFIPKALKWKWNYLNISILVQRNFL